VADYSIMYGYCKTNKIYLHHADIRFYINNNILIPDDYTKIVSIRRPYEKILSAYYYNSWDKKISFKEFIVKKLEEIYNRNSVIAKNHFCPQINYYKDGFNIIKLENIKQDCAKLNIQITDRKHAQTKAFSHYNNYLDAYDQKTKDIVYSIYKEDFLTFNYSA
jgi:phosphopentomutase